MEFPLKVSERKEREVKSRRRGGAWRGREEKRVKRTERRGKKGPAKQKHSLKEGKGQEI